MEAQRTMDGCIRADIETHFDDKMDMRLYTTEENLDMITITNQ